ncbi:hypothetical protein ULMS_24120 [Patiriisocius marinistellae]|uniref:DUF4367 domain-containing protein n=1 Tax=Patiriisocius marinistellae TaxID=2494560 RepID=A0A5J4G077_9FLAO|nr:hypothetical protein [Patiriisocius marinistellae]GEQ86904.1 hypothetical protein ULMS_24120 [Patiriisocius marinistellae]
MFKSFQILIWLSLLTNFCYAQELPTSITEKHVLIEGTNIYLIPPTTFEQSTNFKGLANPEDQTMMIMTMEIPGPYPEVKNGFTTEMLEKQGMELKSKKEIKIAGYDGLYIELDQSANGLVFSKEMLIYGNNEFTMLINGMHLQEDIAAGKSIKASVLSAYIDNDLALSPRETLAFTVDETVGALKFNSVIGNAMFFNRDLKTPTESEDKATLIIDKSYAEVEIRDKKKFCISRLNSYPDTYSLIKEKGVEDISLDSIDGYALYAKNDNTENEEMYQVILFNEDGGYFIFVGTYLSESVKAESDIKKVIETFKTKN